jgi:hypothetical protein
MTLDHRPIQEQYKEKMNKLAALLDDYFNPDPNNKQTCFVLLISPFGDRPDGRVNYISNGRRKECTKLLREVLARFDGGDNRKLSIDDLESIMRGMSSDDLAQILKDDDK